MQLFKTPHIQFLKYKYIALAVTAVIVDDGAEDRREEGECRVCFQGLEDQYKIIFTRRRRDSKSSWGRTARKG